MIQYIIIRFFGQIVKRISLTKPPKTAKTAICTNIVPLKARKFYYDRTVSKV